MKSTRQSMIDSLMEKASEALARTDYFGAETHAMKAMERAFALHDFERMARIALPLQEARRQRRLLAVDSGHRAVLSTMPKTRSELAPGCYLLRPPLIGADARTLRHSADASKVPVFILTREPRTGAGKWPMVAVGRAGSRRVQVEPPLVEGRAIGDDEPPPVEWMLEAEERLGDAAIARLNAADPPAWRVEDLLDALDALPEHEKLHQRLADACREAQHTPLPERKRRKGAIDDPYAF